ncbi:MAG: photosynthetic reaction center cytochrome c subunit [Acidobacteriaceae bacterium]|nr:photosynthetic reaction center cytochrome c subunit [Acidobacteriaceae bacterium]
MRFGAALLLACSIPVTVAAQQSDRPALLGVWKADLSKSKIAGPPVTDYLMLVEQKTVVVNRRTGEKGTEFDEATGVKGQRGEQRSVLSFFPTGKPVVRYYQGVPNRITAAFSGNDLSLTAEVAGRPTVMKRSYVISPDGQTLTLTVSQTGTAHDIQNTIVLLKQPDSAAEPLRAPEETAEKHYKNVKTEALKDVPTSQFIDQMRYFAWSLGKDCEFCHVQGKFDVDDKKEKKTAREMIKMTASINAGTFEGRQEVRCFTCHEMHTHPLSRPQFPDEIQNVPTAANASGTPVGSANR